MKKRTIVLLFVVVGMLVSGTVTTAVAWEGYSCPEDPLCNLDTDCGCDPIFFKTCSDQIDSVAYGPVNRLDEGTYTDFDATPKVLCYKWIFCAENGWEGDSVCWGGWPGNYCQYTIYGLCQLCYHDPYDEWHNETRTHYECHN